MDLAKLKTEISLPAYAGMADDEIATMLNARGRSVDREAIDGGKLVSCITRAEFTALAAPDREYIRLLAGTATPIPLTATIRTELRDMFPAGTATRQALRDVLKRDGTKAEGLALGGAPTASDVANARRS